MTPRPRRPAGARSREPWLTIACLNALFLPLAVLITIIYSLASVAIVFVYAVTVRRRRKVLWLIRRLISYYGRAILAAAWPWVRVSYEDLSPEDDPPFVYMANHRAACDAFLMAVLPVEAIQVVNIWPFRIPWIGFMARVAGYLSVREMPFAAFRDAGAKLLHEGVNIITFPEGTRSGSVQMGQFNSSAVRLAMAAKASIAPLAIAGSERTPPRGSVLLRPAWIRIQKLPAITPQHYEGMRAFAVKQRVRHRLQQHLDRIEGRAGGPDDALTSIGGRTAGTGETDSTTGSAPPPSP